MGITKKHIHSERQIALARMFKALGHPARLAIIENLLAHDHLNCNDLRKHIQLSQSTISAHIKELHEVGILIVKVVANNAYYQVHKENLEDAMDYMEKTIDKIPFALKPDPLTYKFFFSGFSLKSPNTA